MVSTPHDVRQQSAAARMPGAPDSPCDSETHELLKEMLSLVSDRWTLLVIAALREGPQRFSTIQALVRGVSHRMLSKTLRCLLRDGMVTRTAYAEMPPRVEYELTALGLKLLDLVGGVVDWTQSHGHDVRTNREQFDRKCDEREQLGRERVDREQPDRGRA
ncbi:winged helix-turn-helix transcriptional regulator [Promicromonospora sp. NPDC057138]|uniref:winged helix-turn-helix transcriptional regulator n=1 Tax=Promicromonospora sp. NPDC057138 TaxID=3346031 RepID=UPI0036308BF9